MGRPYKKPDDDKVDLLEFLRIVAELGKTVSVLGSAHQQSQRETAAVPLSQAEKAEDVRAKRVATDQLEEAPSSAYAREIAGKLERGEVSMDVENMPEIRKAVRVGGVLDKVGEAGTAFPSLGFMGVKSSLDFLKGKQSKVAREARENPDVGQYHAEQNLMHHPAHPVFTERRVRPEDIAGTKVPYAVATEMSATEEGKRLEQVRTLETSAQKSREAIALKTREGTNRLQEIDAILHADMAEMAFSKFSELTGMVGVGGTFDEVGLSQFEAAVRAGTNLVIPDEEAFAELRLAGKLDTYRLPFKNEKTGRYDLEQFLDREPATYVEYVLAEKYLAGKTEVELRESIPGMQQVPGAIDLMYASEDLFWNQHRRGGILGKVEALGDEEALKVIGRALAAAGLAGGTVGGVGIGTGLGAGFVPSPEPVAEPSPEPVAVPSGGEPASYSFGMNAAAGFLQERGVDLANETTAPQVMMILEKMSQIEPGWENDPLAMEWFENVANGLRLQQELLRRAGMR